MRLIRSRYSSGEAAGLFCVQLKGDCFMRLVHRHKTSEGEEEIILPVVTAAEMKFANRQSHWTIMHHFTNTVLVEHTVMCTLVCCPSLS